MEKENLLSMEEKKNEEGKGGKYLEKDNIFFVVEGKNGEGKYLEKENLFFGRGEEERRRKRRKLFGEGNLMVAPTDRHCIL